MGRHLSLRCGQVILVRGYPVLTAVNWSQYWCPICVHYQFSCALELARKYEIEHWSWPSKTINWSADSFQINHVTSMTCLTDRSHVSWHMRSVSGYPVLTAVNWPYFECQIWKMWICQDAPETPLPSFDSVPYSTRTICRRVRTYVGSVNNVTTKRKEVGHILWVWGSVPSLLGAGGSPAITLEVPLVFVSHSLPVNPDGQLHV